MARCSSSQRCSHRESLPAHLAKKELSGGSLLVDTPVVGELGESLCLARLGSAVQRRPTLNSMRLCPPLLCGGLWVAVPWRDRDTSTW